MSKHFDSSDFLSNFDLTLSVPDSVKSDLASALSKDPSNALLACSVMTSVNLDRIATSLEGIYKFLLERGL